MKKNIIAVMFIASILPSCGNNDLRLVVGTYTDGGSEGLYSFSFNQQTGESAALDSCKAANPSYLTISRDGRHIYAVSELGSGNAAVHAISFDRQGGSMTEINTVLAGGPDPCYISTNGKMVVTANYGGSLSVIRLAKDGSLKGLKSLFNGSTGGPDTLRQSVPHIHCAVFSPDGKHLYASDFSADRLLCFDVVKRGKELRPSTAPDGQQLIAKVSPDYGPRHIVFDRKGRHAYLIGELSGTVTVFDVDNGVLTPKQTVDADPYDGRGSADIHLGPDGKFLYVSNRLKGDGISVFKVDKASGRLSGAGYCETGRHPRHFNITPNGRFLLCACRDENEIQIYSIDKKSGMPAYTGKSIPLSKPVCVQFVQ